MTEADEERAGAARLPAGSVVAALLEQHAAIRDLFAEVKEAAGDRRRQLFDELRRLLAVHEAGEEMVLRPVTQSAAGPDVAKARNQEEAEAGHVLADLEQMDTDAPEFEAAFAAFEQAVSEHAVSEERLEFSKLLQERSPEDLEQLGRTLLAGQSAASAQQRIGTDSAGSARGAAVTFDVLLARAGQAFKG